MGLGSLLDDLAGDDIKDVIDLVRKNRGVLERLGDLPELFDKFAAGLDDAADQAKAAGLALVGDEGRVASAAPSTSPPRRSSRSRGRWARARRCSVTPPRASARSR